jgi:transcriptional regulator with XRE-family HTH domain
MTVDVAPDKGYLLPMSQRLVGQPPGLVPDGPKIRELRIERGITPTALARQIGRARSSIWNMEGTSRPISRVFAVQLATALGVTVADLLAEDDDESDAEAKVPA